MALKPLPLFFEQWHAESPKPISPTLSIVYNKPMPAEFSFAVHPDYLAIGLNRPSRRNSLTLNLIESLLGVLNQNPTLTLLLSAASPAFCAGFDLDWIAQASQNPTDFKIALDRLYALYRAILIHPSPTVAIVEGPAIGGGAGLAFCFDHILVSPNARFALPQGELKPLADIVLPVAHRKIPHWTGNNITADQALFQHIADGPIASFPIGSFLKIQKKRIPLDENQVKHFIQTALLNREKVGEFLRQK